MTRQYGKFTISDEWSSGTFGVMPWVWWRGSSRQPPTHEGWNGPYPFKWIATLVGWWKTR